ncbi:acyl-CoA-like ligand-binding transcription factor [Mycobacterium seoulense]|uniref:acyl-CoA-like ligand-binding transcription factor n=2 Tax=Mycobacteriaceae TaxID=1762 RepID=UPI001304C6A9|nr:hypothetical protein [Mycobacterium seoulense]
MTITTLVVADVVARRRGLSAPDAECAMPATVGMSLLESAMSQWLAGSARSPSRTSRSVPSIATS